MLAACTTPTLYKKWCIREKTSPIRIGMDGPEVFCKHDIGSIVMIKGCLEAFSGIKS